MLDFQGTARPGTCRRQHFCSHPFYIVFVLDTNRFAKLVWSQTFHATYHDVNVQSARRIANTRDSFNANNPWICSYQESAEQTRRSVCCILRINKCWFAITTSRHVILPQYPETIRVLWWHIKKRNPLTNGWQTVPISSRYPVFRQRLLWSGVQAKVAIARLSLQTFSTFTFLEPLINIFAWFCCKYAIVSRPFLSISSHRNCDR